MKTVSLRSSSPVSQARSRVAHGARARRATPTLRPVVAAGPPVSRWQLGSDGRLVCSWSLQP